ncbi:MAG: hypothetical protein H7248_00690 [Microbacteriaceae bacterium]|nr:hypothetical protein [Microbacteriaceae bacterium]
MWLRRTYYYAQPLALVALPLWIMIASIIARPGLGAADILTFLAWPALAVSMLLVLLLTRARGAVRGTRSLSWPDVAGLSLWFATAISFGVFIVQSSRVGTGTTGGLLLLVSLAVTASAIAQLVAAARRRVETVLAAFDGTPIAAGHFEATPVSRDDSPVIRIDPKS